MHHAVIIGINQYQDASYRALEYARTDARRLTKRLLTSPRTVFKNESVSLLVDDPERGEGEALFNAIWRSLGDMCDRATERDLILFYFSGHGFGEGEAAYLVASDTERAGIPGTVVGVQMVLDRMKKSRASQKVLILDACRAPAGSGAAVREKSAVDRGAMDFSSVIQKTINLAAESPGWELITSCDTNQYSWEDGELKAGVWTDALLRGIQEFYEKQCTITVELLFNRARQHVLEWANKKGRQQGPRYMCSKAGSATLLPLPEPPSPEAMPEAKLKGIVASQKIRILRQVLDETGKPQLTTSPEVLEDEPSIHLVPFESHFRGTGFPEDPQALRKHNNDFRLRLYLPAWRKNAPPYKRLNILFNGLAESDPVIIDGVGWNLAANKGVPSVLLPLPMHFCRNYLFPQNEVDPYQPRDRVGARLTTLHIVQMLLGMPTSLVSAFMQMLGDTERLIETINDREHAYWTELFIQNPRLTLFGYSLGGCIAMSVLLLNPDRYDSVFLLESGGTIDKVNAGALLHRPELSQQELWKHYYEEGTLVPKHESLFHKFEEIEVPGQPKRVPRFELWQAALSERGKNPRECPPSLKFLSQPHRIFERDATLGQRIWQDLVACLHDILEHDKISTALTIDERKVFERVFLGNEPLRHKRQLEAVAHKILILTGGADEVFPTRMLIDIGPDTGLALLQIPGISHWLKYGARVAWKQWRNLAIDLMEAFDAGHPRPTSGRPS